MGCIQIFPTCAQRLSHPICRYKPFPFQLCQSRCRRIVHLPIAVSNTHPFLLGMSSAHSFSSRHWWFSTDFHRLRRLPCLLVARRMSALPKLAPSPLPVLRRMDGPTFSYRRATICMRLMQLCWLCGSSICDARGFASTALWVQDAHATLDRWDGTVWGRCCSVPVWGIGKRRMKCDRERWLRLVAGLKLRYSLPAWMEEGIEELQEWL